MKRALVAGGAGFIGSHLARALQEAGYWVRCVDWKQPEFLRPEQFCDEFLTADLRREPLAMLAMSGGPFDVVCQLAADMGGMGFIQGGHDAEIAYNNALINLNMLGAARTYGCGVYLYTSSACVYPLYLQDGNTQPVLLREDMAYPAQPQDTYGWEKLWSEQVLAAFARQYDLNTRTVRFHNVYGPEGTYKGGREKAPAAFCRKVAEAKLKQLPAVEMWGDGEQTRSFLYIDDCVEGLLRLLEEDYKSPINLGYEGAVSMNELMSLVMKIAGYQVPVEHVHGPVGVRNRDCDALLAKRVLGWQAKTDLATGIGRLYAWIERQVKHG